MRRASLLLLGAALGVAVTMTAAQPPLAQSGADTRPVARTKNYRLLDLFGSAFETVRSHYVTKPDDSKLIAAAANGLLADLKDSYYLDAKTADRTDACAGPECARAFGNVGVAFTIEEGFAKVITPIDDSPAAKAGIMAGDLITRIDDDQIQGLTHYQIGEKLRGPVGTTIRLGLTRSGRDQPIDISIVRDMISLRSIRTRTDAADIGYIRVVQFNESTAEQLKKGIEDIAAQIAPDKLKGYVLDLRNNPGGLQEAAIALADAFLEDGEIVAIRSRGTEEVRRFRAKAGDLVAGKPVIVLINGGSASTAEVVAGALQDHRRATVVGTRSFGKGSVATLIPLGPGKGAIHLATGQYITPSGRVIEAKGLTPEVEVRQDAPDDLKRDAKPNDAKPGDAKPGDAKPNAKPTVTKPLPLQSYIPADPKADKALERAYDLLRRGRAEAKVAVPE